MASGTDTDGVLKLGEEVTIYLSVLETDREVQYPQREDRRTHIYLIAGNLEVSCSEGDFQLQPGDAARIRKSCDLKLKGTSSEGDAEFILIDLP